MLYIAEIGSHSEEGTFHVVKLVSKIGYTGIIVGGQCAIWACITAEQNPYTVHLELLFHSVALLLLRVYTITSDKAKSVGLEKVF